MAYAGEGADLHTPLLSFRNVSLRYRDGPREVPLLEGVSFELYPGSSLGVYGERRSGKSTLLRLAAGLQLAHSGAVTFDGVDLATLSPRARATLLRNSLALLTPTDCIAGPGETVIDRVATARGCTGLSLREARRFALSTLDRVGAASLSEHEAGSSLSCSERALVALAKALVREPRLLLVDEPPPVPSISERDRFIALLRSVARERHISLLLASEDLTALQGLSTLASLSRGELSLAGEPPNVVPFPVRPAAEVL